MSENKKEFTRHIIATVAYRGGKAIRNAPDTFGDFKAGDSTKTPVQILAHIGDLYDWALSQAKGAETWNNSTPLSWDDEVERFFDALTALDKFLSSGEEIHISLERLFQGALADSLTHIGQIAMLRRLADSPIKGENYSRAKIEKGSVGANQPEPANEFD
ncbi:MAG: hypothetical protein KDB79_08945 [Acidobacteria bacterium]|nr:hypothetical protein [Acidobacteriota bacterium]